jgi:hypothetical protein
MIKEKFQELSTKLQLLKKQSNETRDVQVRRSLLKEMRAVLKEIDDLLRHQVEWNHSASRQEH